MKKFELIHIIDNKEQEDKLTDLARRCKTLNGWTESDLLQFAVNAMPMNKIWLAFLEDIIIDLEQSQLPENQLLSPMQEQQQHRSH